MRHHLSPAVSGSAALLSVLIIAVLPQPAAAKSLLESLFGFLTPQAPAKPNNTIVSPKPSEVFDFNPFAVAPHEPPQRPAFSQRYRTVCVRLCDGYFFPISNASRRGDFYADSQQCQARCRSDTRLYYMPSNAPSIERARDQNGYAYTDLKTAFRYRKKITKSCACRPAPWSVSERMRHKSYLPVSQPASPGAAVAANAQGDSTVLAAAPTMIGEGGIARPAYETPLHPPAPYEVHRAIAPPQIVRQRPAKQPSWGLGASLASSLPKVKYRHDWSND